MGKERTNFHDSVLSVTFGSVVATCRLNTGQFGKLVAATETAQLLLYPFHVFEQPMVLDQEFAECVFDALSAQGNEVGVKGLDHPFLGHMEIAKVK